MGGLQTSLRRQLLLIHPGPLWSTYGNGWCAVDGNLITARWPGDAEVWSRQLVESVQDSIEAVPTEHIAG